MGVFKRYKNAQAAQKEAENAMPGAYQSNYTDRINEALDSMGAASNAGYDVGTDSELYRQYRAGAQANAKAAAENAAAGAAALSGGYGSSYANSVAQQGYQQAMANVDSGLAGLRDKALTMYQLKQNGLSGLLSALQNQDSLEAAEHQGAVANAQDWRDYKKSRADQAAQEKQNFWDNLMQVGTDVVKAGFTAYDRYKGFVAPVVVAGTKIYEAVVVNEYRSTKQGNKFYVHEVCGSDGSLLVLDDAGQIKQKQESADTVLKTEEGGERPSFPANKIITQNDAPVKKNIRFQRAEQADREAKQNQQRQASRVLAEKAAAFDTLNQFFGLTKNTRLSDAALESLAIRWTKTNGSRADRTKLANETRALVEYLRSEGADMAKAQGLAETLAGEVLDEATYRNTELWNEYPDLHNLTYTVDKHGKDKGRIKSKITEAVKEEYLAGSDGDREKLEKKLLALEDADGNPLYEEKDFAQWVSAADKKAEKAKNERNWWEEVK